jgi:hypothetical protein
MIDAKLDNLQHHPCLIQHEQDQDYHHRPLRASTPCFARYRSSFAPDINSEVQRRQIGELNQRLSALVAKSSSVAIRYCLILVNDYFEHFSEN